EEAAQAAQAKAESARIAAGTPVERGRRGGPRPPRTAPTPYASFPVPGSVQVVLHPVGNGNAVGSLGLTQSKNQQNEKLIDDVSFNGSALALAAQSPHRLLFATAPLPDTVHISGTSRITLRIAFSKPAANLTVWLVQLPFDSTTIGTS